MDVNKCQASCITSNCEHLIIIKCTGAKKNISILNIRTSKPCQSQDKTTKVKVKCEREKEKKKRN